LSFCIGSTNPANANIFNIAADLIHFSVKSKITNGLDTSDSKKNNGIKAKQRYLKYNL